MAGREVVKTALAGLVSIGCTAAVTLGAKLPLPPDPTEPATWLAAGTMVSTFVGAYAALKQIMDGRTASPDDLKDALEPIDQKAEQLAESIARLQASPEALEPDTVVLHAREQLVRIVLSGTLSERETLEIVSDFRAAAFPKSKRRGRRNG